MSAGQGDDGGERFATKQQHVASRIGKARLAEPDHGIAALRRPVDNKSPHRRTNGAGSSTPDRIRTCDLVLRRHALYPTELRAQNRVDLTTPSTHLCVRPSTKSRRRGAVARTELRAHVFGKRISRVLSPSFRPGARHLSGTTVARRLERPTRGPAAEATSTRAASHPCLALLRVGFTMRRLLPAPRCALTAPFHPCLCASLRRRHRRSALCGTFQRLAASGRYPAPCPVELGLSSAAPVTRHGRGPHSLPSQTADLPFGRPSTPGRIRTPDLLIRSQTLYPAELRAHTAARKNRPRLGVRPAGFGGLSRQP